MNKVIAALVLLLAAAIAQASSPVSERADYWRQRLAQELPVGTSRGEIQAWVSKNHLTAADRLETHELIIGLESVPAAKPTGLSSASPTVCKGFGISATVKFDAEDRLASARVETAGNCL